MKKYIHIFLFSLYSILISQYSFSQNSDSLWKVYNNKLQPDSNRLQAIHQIARSYFRNNPDTAIILAEQELKFAESLPNDKGKVWAAKAINTIGASFYNKNNYPKTLEYYLKALHIFEELKDKKGIGTCYNNIGLVYNNESEYAKAIDYYLKSLKIREEIKDKGGIGSCYNNIGLAYMNQSNYAGALKYYLKALEIDKDIDDKIGIGDCYSNIGIVYDKQSNHPKALAYYLKALQLRKETANELGMGICYGNMGTLYNKSGNYKLVIQYADSELMICKKIGDIEGEREAYQNLATAYSKTNKYKEAYENHIKFKQLTDSIFNTDNSKQLGDLKTKFEVEKKEAELKIKSDAEQEKLKAVSLEEKKRQNVIIYAVAGVLLLVIVFSLFLYNRFRITHKQKEVIEKQKVLVDEAYNELHEKNKEVMDSIHYAKRIQRALITSEHYIEKTLNKLINKN